MLLLIGERKRGEDEIPWSTRLGADLFRVALPNARLTDLQSLPPDTIELGMGAHGEPGLRRLSPIPELQDLIAEMLDLLVDMSDTDRAFIPFERASYYLMDSNSGPTDNELVLLVNSLGSTSDEVLARFAELAIKDLEGRGFVVRRLTLGPLVTSLKMSGFGLTIWRLPTEESEGAALDRKTALELWDERVGCVAWRQ